MVSAGPVQGLRTDHRLRRRADYQRCYRRGRKRHGAWVSLHFHSNDQQRPRIGITASRKVGNAVVRHGIKRRVREIYRRWPRRGELPAADLVVHVHPAARGASFSQLQDEIGRLLSQICR